MTIVLVVFFLIEKMKLTKEQIMERIKQLPPLEILSYEFYGVRRSPFEFPTKVPNSKILEELEDIINKFNHDTQKKPNLMVPEQPEQPDSLNEDFRQSYYITPVKKLKFKESPTFFSPRFEEKLKSLISDKSYNELSQEEVIQLNTELQNLSTVEFEWKEYHRRATTKEMSHEQFEEEYKRFLTVFDTLRSPKDEDLKGQRAETKFMPYKIGYITLSLIHYLYIKLDFKALSFCIDFKAEQFGEIVSSHIDPQRIFNDLSRISIKKAHEKLLNIQDETAYTDDVLSISRIELFEEFRKTLLVEIFYAVLTFGERSHKLSPSVADALSREVQMKVFYKNLLISLEASYKQHVLEFSDLTNSTLEAFISSGFFTNSITTITKSNKSSVQLILPDHIIVDAYRPMKFPNIIRPPVLKKKDIDKLIKPLINGQGSLTKSDYLVATLNISRSKVHQVNELFLSLSRRFFPRNIRPGEKESVLSLWLQEGDIDIGTEHEFSVRKLDNQYQFLKEKANSTMLTLYIANRVITQLSTSHNTSLKSFGSLLVPCGMTKAETLRFYAVKVLENDYISKIIETKYTQSRLFLAEQLRGFPLFITDILCIRLRMYPREHWLSRTAGSFKHLLQNFKPQKLTLQGLITMLEAYYMCSPEKLAEFKLYLSQTTISNKTGKSLLLSYFYTNPVDFTRIRKPMYFLNLHLGLLNLTNTNYSTAINVEIDQNASALVILSIVLRSKEMASVCNLTGGKEKVSPYDYIKQKCAEYLETDSGMTLNVPEYADVCEFLRTSRELHKYAIMCFCYNQTSIGRMDDFENRWREQFGYTPNKTQKKALNKFAVLYPEFVEFVFPNTDRKLEIFKSIVRLVCSEAPHLQMKTIDGEVINWAFYATSYQNRKYYDIVERTHKSYKTRTYRERKQSLTFEVESNTEDFPKNLELDQIGMKRRFLSYFIHSIDASILRRIIHTMKKEYKVSVNHLHDCIILHPNDVHNFYKVVKQIYSSPELYNIVLDGLFDSIANTLSPESNEKLSELKTEFMSLTSDFKDEILNMNPQHMYSLED